ncbi:MAG: hypothetical protein LH618_01530 [Saprospiraceae bacterium]|nr:hypothetical protein [Saprospiraceae bacterium]
MNFDRLINLSIRDLELHRLNQYNILRFTVLYEVMLVKERGQAAMEETRNEALDIIIIINQIIAERHDNDPSAT